MEPIQKDIREVIKEGWKVDKIKFKFILRQKKDIQKILNHLAKETITKYWPSNHIDECKYNFNLEQQGGTIYIGIESNQYKGNTEEKMKTVILEYNPQKVNPFEYDFINELKQLDLHRRDIMLIDMAYDMYININDLEYIKRRKNEYECKISHETLETTYLRKMGTNGAVRIYNKALEMNGGSNENLDLDTGEVQNIKYIGDLTRYEIRIKPGQLGKQFNIVNPFLIEETTKLHELHIKTPNQEEQILKKIYEHDGNDFTNLIAVHLGAEYKLNNRAKKKYKELYQEIKKSCTSTTEYNDKLKDFNTTELYKTLKSYLQDTTFYTDNSIIVSEFS